MLSFSPSCVSVSSHRAMSSLYGHPDWSTNVESVISELIGPGIKIEDAWNWLCEREGDECFSLTDVWAAVIALIMKKVPRQWATDNISNLRNNTLSWQWDVTLQKKMYFVLLAGPKMSFRRCWQRCLQPLPHLLCHREGKSLTEAWRMYLHYIHMHVPHWDSKYPHWYK